MILLGVVRRKNVSKTNLIYGLYETPGLIQNV